MNLTIIFISFFQFIQLPSHTSYDSAYFQSLVLHHKDLLSIMEIEELIHHPPEADCNVPIIPDRRWYMVAVIGTSLSFLSLICNLIIAISLLRSKHSHFFFLAILAISDSFLSLMYGPVIAMDIIKDRVQILFLSRAYWFYLPSLLAVCHTSMTFSTYLIALATIERWLITKKSEILTCFRSNRGALAAFAFASALLLRGTEYFEVEMEQNGNCTNLTEYAVDLTDLARDWYYTTIFRFYIRNITTVLVPFFLLAFLNYSIVKNLRKQQRTAAMFRFPTSRHKLKVRSATRLTVLIVFSYLTANVLNVLITAWEYIHFESTQEEYFIVYEILTDIVSVMYIGVCATRLFVYVFVNEEIRNEVVATICALRDRDNIRKSSQTSGKGPSELDSIALSIARRLIKHDIDIDKNDDQSDETQPLDGKTDESPMHAIVIANGYSRCTSDADDV